MERFFPAAKIVFTGNPVRKDLLPTAEKTAEAREYFNISRDKKVLLVVGGSLGARTLNNSLLASIEQLAASEVEVIWQTGKIYFPTITGHLQGKVYPTIHIHEFVSRMDLAYALADLVISRAGAGTISELCLMRKPSILVPSPNVAEDHQTRNAMALVGKQAALLVRDEEALEMLVAKALQTLNDPVALEKMASQIALLAKPNASSDIAHIIIKLAAER